MQGAPQITATARMAFLSIFKRQAAATPATPSPESAADLVQRARVRARRRLIGAVVLIGIGIIGFPLLFETYPRPIPVDIPIEIANKDTAPPLAMPPARSASGAAANPGDPSGSSDSTAGANSGSAGDAAVAASQPPGAGSSTTVAAAASSPRQTTAPSSAAERTAAGAASPGNARVGPSAGAAAAARSTPSDAASAPGRPAPTASTPAAEAASAAGRTARTAAATSTVRDASPRTADARAPAEPAASSGRFVVQVGAYSEASSARQVREKAEKLGLKTHTQVVATASGERIRVRVGPFASREEADRAAGKLKSAGLPAALVAL
jgi:DedD protein